MTSKCKVTFDREGCIGAAACAAVAPEHWEMAEDNKAVLKRGKINPATGLYEKDVEDEHEQKAHQEAADVCPVSVIKLAKKP